MYAYMCVYTCMCLYAHTQNRVYSIYTNIHVATPNVQKHNISYRIAYHAQLVFTVAYQDSHSAY